MDTSVWRSQQSYWTYGFKAFTAEQQPDTLKGKGFNERVFVIKCSPGNPDYDIIEIINNAGDEKYKLLFNELLDIRKLLLIYRLLHHNDPIPDIVLNIKNREIQLCKPLIRLFQGTNAINDILASLSKLLMEKKETLDTLEARLYHIINDFINKNNGSLLDIDDKVILESTRIWNIVKEELEGEEIPGKPRSYDTSEYGVVPRLRSFVY
jgi:hypothetical protein